MKHKLISEPKTVIGRVTRVVAMMLVMTMFLSMGAIAVAESDTEDELPHELFELDTDDLPDDGDDDVILNNTLDNGESPDNNYNDDALNEAVHDDEIDEKADPDTVDKASTLTYLETGISSASRNQVRRVPTDVSSFEINGTSYTRGLANVAGSQSNGNATYNIAGQGFTRLTGVFGRIGALNNTAPTTGTLTISADGVLVGGYTASSHLPVAVDIAIPANTQNLYIRLQSNGGTGSVGLYAFGDAALNAGDPIQQPTHPPAVPGAVYLESNIQSTSRTWIGRYPLDGSFSINGTNYFRGFTNTQWRLCIPGSSLPHSPR